MKSEKEKLLEKKQKLVSQLIQVDTEITKIDIVVPEEVIKEDLLEAEFLKQLKIHKTKGFPIESEIRSLRAKADKLEGELIKLSNQTGIPFDGEIMQTYYPKAFFDKKFNELDWDFLDQLEVRSGPDDNYEGWHGSTKSC